MATKARAYAEQARADYDAYVASGEEPEPDQAAALGEHGGRVYHRSKPAPSRHTMATPAQSVAQTRSPSSAPV